jgi:hypothetical protein
VLSLSYTHYTTNNNTHQEPGMSGAATPLKMYPLALWRFMSASAPSPSFPTHKNTLNPQQHSPGAGHVRCCHAPKNIALCAVALQVSLSHWDGLRQGSTSGGCGHGRGACQAQREQ